MITIKSVLALAAFSALSASATASTITFDGLGGTNIPGNSQVLNAYGTGNQTYFSGGATALVDGFNFKGGNYGPLLFTPVHVNDPAGLSAFAWNGTDYLVGIDIQLASNTKTPFSVSGIDLAAWAGAMNIIVSGTRSNGSVVSKTFSSNNDHTAVANDFATYTLTDFSDLTSLSIRSQASWIAVDNIALVDANDVPEPASLAMLGLGLAGMGAIRRQRKS